MKPIEELRRICEKATPEWKFSTVEDWSTDEVSRRMNGWIDGVLQYGECGSHEAKWFRAEDQAYIHAFSPAQVLKILDGYEAMRSALESIYEEPNRMHPYDADTCAEEYGVKAWDIARTCLASLGGGSGEGGV